MHEDCASVFREVPHEFLCYRVGFEFLFPVAVGLWSSHGLPARRVDHVKLVSHTRNVMMLLNGRTGFFENTGGKPVAFRSQQREPHAGCQSDGERERRGGVISLTYVQHTDVL